MPFAKLPHDVLEVIFEHLRDALDWKARLAQGFLIASVCRAWRDYGHSLALRDLLLPHDGGSVAEYLLANPHMTDFVRRIVLKCPHMTRCE